MKHFALFCVLLFIPPSASTKDTTINAKTIDTSTIIVGDNNHVETIRATALQLPSAEVELDIGIAGWGDSDSQKLLSSFNSPSFEYKLTDTGSFLHILPDDNYLNPYIQGKKISSLVYGYYEAPTFHVCPPTFDIRIINNSSKSITLKEIIFDVKKSRIDNKPFVIFITATDKFGEILVVNEGNHPIESIDIEYSLYPKKKEYDKKGKRKYKYSLSIGRFKKSTVLDFRKALKDSGADIEYLEKAFIKDKYPGEHATALEKALDPFIYSEDIHTNEPTDKLERYSIKKYTDAMYEMQFQAYVSGEYRVVSVHGGKSYERKGEFDGYIPLTPPEGLGDDLLTLEKFQAKLKNTGDNYTIRMPISAYLKPFDVEKYLFRVFTDKTTEHEFTIKVLLNNDKIITSKKMKLYLFSPKSTIESESKWLEFKEAELVRIKTLQRRLKQKGYYTGSIDGIEGRETTLAAADECVANHAPPPQVNPEDSEINMGVDAGLIEIKLKCLGFYDGPITGIVSAELRSALQRYINSPLNKK